MLGMEPRTRFEGFQLFYVGKLAATDEARVCVGFLGIIGRGQGSNSSEDALYCQFRWLRYCSKTGSINLRVVRRESLQQQGVTAKK